MPLWLEIVLFVIVFAILFVTWYVLGAILTIIKIDHNATKDLCNTVLAELEKYSEDKE